jgi:putative ABC transport system substrate-binding protein
MTADTARKLGYSLVLAGAIGLVPSIAVAAVPYRIGAITEAWAANHPAVEGLKEGLREQGLVEGRDVIYDVRFTRGKPGAAEAAAEALVKAGVDLIFTSDHAPTAAAKKATKSIPIVFTLVGDPVAVQMVDSLPYPGGNLTGVSSRSTDLAPKRLELLRQLVPKLRRVWFIYYAGDVTDSAALANLDSAASQLHLELVARSVNDASMLSHTLKELRAGDALLAPSSNTLDIPVSVLETALASRIPAIFPSSIWVSNGGLVAYGADFRAQGVQAARLVAKILRGARSQDLPVEGAENIDLALNLKMVKLLGLAVPRTILFRANIVDR